ncbi:hypothetical protein [Peribacillus deserti]|uniref:Uncharacterized protein n=1 Tax=Peribacillus deserti TaxID=673318 RepID=A0A2N5MB01_9BACI|nr:hypothetical protein [Peribacillus deserti]PLT31517.1 hypothetical protein CUU66_02165 [Peribacillus deserti]
MYMQLNENEEQSYIFEMEDSKGELVVSGKIRGDSEMEFYDDLKLKAVIALLNSVDQERFTVHGKNSLFSDYISEIEDTISQIKRFESFQGETK